jgi:hypothetical protein
MEQSSIERQQIIIFILKNVCTVKISCGCCFVREEINSYSLQLINYLLDWQFINKYSIINVIKLCFSFYLSFFLPISSSNELMNDFVTHVNGSESNRMSANVYFVYKNDYS